MNRTLIAAAVVALGLTACGETDNLGPGSTPDPASLPAETATETEAAAATPAPDELEVDEGDEAEGQYLHELAEPVVYESNGVRLSITGVGFTSVDSPVMDEELKSFLEDETQTILALEMTVSNDSGEPISLYANQGTAQLGRNQVDADLWISDDFAGDMNDGVDDDGLVVWQLDVPFDEAVSIGSLTYQASAPSSQDTFESVADEISLTVEWPAP